MSIMMSQQKPWGPEQDLYGGKPAMYAGAGGGAYGGYGGAYGGSPYVGNYGIGSPYVPEMLDEQGPFGVRRPRSNICLFMTGSVFVPWVIFCVVYGAVSFDLHAHQVAAMHAICAITFVIVLALGVHTFNTFRRWGRQEASWPAFLFVTGLIAWIIGMLAGESNFAVNMRPFYDESSLNFYPSIDPSVAEGQQLMDAGRILFTPESHLDLTKSMGFRNNDMYCAAPIVSGPPNTVGTPSSGTYDFWAVGVNCCAGHASIFQCGEFNNPNARGGLRLMRDDQRPFFRLAVQQAEALYNIQAKHPIFLTWMQDPMLEVHAYQDNGYSYFLLGVFVYFACQLFLTISAYLAFTKMGMY